MKMRERKRFFFEKKNQKTFANCVHQAVRKGQYGAARNRRGLCQAAVIPVDGDVETWGTADFCSASPSATLRLTAISGWIGKSCKIATVL